MDELIAAEYSRYIETKAKIDALNKILKEAHDKIEDYHKKTGQKLIVENGIKSQLVPGERASLNIPALEKKFNIVVPKKGQDGYLDCYKVTPYVSLRIEKIINE